MFFQKNERRDVTQRGMPSNIVIVQHPTLNDTDDANQVSLFPKDRRVLFLKMSVERLHRCIAPGTIQRVRHAHAITETKNAKPLVTRVHAILVLVNHDFVQTYTVPEQSTLGSFPCRQGQSRIRGGSHRPANRPLADMVNNWHEQRRLISTVKDQFGEVRVHQLQRLNVVQMPCQINPGAHRGDGPADPARPRMPYRPQQRQFPGFLQLLHHLVVDHKTLIPQLVGDLPVSLVRMPSGNLHQGVAQKTMFLGIWNRPATPVMPGAFAQPQRF